MTPPPRYRTDSRLWLAVGVVLFVALGFFDPTGGRSKADCSLWTRVAGLVTHCDHPDTIRALVAIAIYAAMLAVPAALVGWAVQAVVVVTRSRRVVNG